MSTEGQESEVERHDAGSHPHRRTVTATTMRHLVIPVGAAATVASLILPFVHGSPWISGVLFLAGVSLLITSAVRFVRREPSLIQALVIIGVTMVSLAFGVGLALTWTQTKSAVPVADCTLLVPPTPAAIIGKTIQEVNGTYAPVKRVPSLELAARWPQDMDINGSEFVGISLGHNVDTRTPLTPRTVPTIVVGGNTCRPTTSLANGKGRLVASPVAVGTPGKPLQRAFGPKYDAFASAELDAIKFNASPTSPTWQALDQQADVWGWTITPQEAGKQVVLFSVDMEWRRRGTDKSLPAVQDRRIWESDPQYIQVNEPPVSTGQLQVSGILSGALATGLAALFTALVATLMPGRSKRGS